MDTMKETLSDLYYPSDIADLDFDLLDQLHYDFNLLGEDDDDDSSSTVIKQEHSPHSEISDICFDAFSSVDSPPLTPPSCDTLKQQQQSQQASSVQVAEQHHQQVNIENESNNNNVLLANEVVGGKFPKILPALKSSRGRAASHDTPDVQALKRHIRMIRNRESASLSRKKKKEYLTGLEGRVKELEIENAKLKHENCVLKSRLSQFLGSNPLGSAKSLASSVFSSSTGKNATLPSVTAKVALLGLCCFMFVSYQKPALLSASYNATHHIGSSLPASRPIALAHDIRGLPVFDSPGGKGKGSLRQRRLLWDERVTNEINDHNWEDNRKNVTAENVTRSVRLLRRRPSEESYDNVTLTGGGGVPTSRCPSAFNQTEAIRVQNDLKGIFSPKNAKRAPAKPFVYSLIDASSNDNKGLTVYDDKMRRFSRVLDHLNRRADTFYVVSLAVENQLLLSAKALNATSRPKMSILMPWKNDTMGGKEELMQIDCEVTQVFNLKRQKRRRGHDNF